MDQRRGPVFFALVVALGLFPGNVTAQTELRSHTFSSWGGEDASGAVSLLQSGSQDLIGLAESSTVQLGIGFLYTLPGLQLPFLALLSPASDGVCAHVGGVIAIIGTVGGSGLVEWRLERAAGEGATSGFTFVSSGTVSISTGILAHIDTSSLSGPQTLRLTASNDHGNVSVIFSGFTVGHPAPGLVFGSLNKPEAVSAAPDGMIAVADTNNNRLVYFSSSGAIATIFDAKKGPSSLNKPSGVFIDQAGNAFVADTNDHRIAMLSPSGALLLELGKKNLKENGNIPGNGPGEFNKPSGVALDGKGNIYVSDTLNGRIQKFNPAGMFLSAFNLPEVSINPGAEDSEDTEGEDNHLGRPVGIALDEAGNIYVADKRGNRVLEFGPDGNILATFGQELLKGPLGIAIDATGDCLLVSDTGHDRIVKFDRTGNVTLVFGGKKVAGEEFSVPSGLALNSTGKLFVADRNNNMVRTFDDGEPISILASRRGGLKPSEGSQLDSDVPTSFVFRDVYVFPNPARRRERPTFRVQVGLADSVDIACYDVAGGLVHRGQGNSPQIIDDGNGKGRQYTYDAAWNTDSTGSGVYACLMTARRAGHTDIRKIVKAAVVK